MDPIRFFLDLLAPIIEAVMWTLRDAVLIIAVLLLLALAALLISATAGAMVAVFRDRSDRGGHSGQAHV